MEDSDHVPWRSTLCCEGQGGKLPRAFSRSALQRPEHFRANDHVPLHRVLPALSESDESLCGASTKSHAGVHKDGPMQCLRHEEIEAGDASGRRSPRYRPQVRSLGLLLSSLLAPLVQRDSLRNGFGNALLDLFLTLLLDDLDLGDNQKLGFIVHLLLTIRERFPLREKLKVLEYVGHVKKVARRHLFGVFFVATFPIRVALDITVSEVIEQLSDPTLSK